MKDSELNSILSKFAKTNFQKSDPLAAKGCLTDELLSSFIDGNCNSVDYARVMVHLSSCDDCLSVICSSVYWQEDVCTTEKQYAVDISSNSLIDYIQIPLLGNVACGPPVEVFENIEKTINIPKGVVKPSNKYYFLRAHGDSLDKLGINEGDLVLIIKKNTANNGEIVAVLIDGESTLKEYHNKGNAIVLKSRSTNPNNKDIVLAEEFQVQGVVAKDSNGNIVVLKGHL